MLWRLQTALLITYSFLITPAKPNNRLLQQYAISVSRTESYESYCQKYERDELIDSQDSYFQTWVTLKLSELSLTMNKRQYFEDIMANRMNEVWKKFQGEPKDLVLYLVFFLAGLVQLIIAIPFLICCCACPDGCPLCFKKSIYIKYTRKQIKIPSIFVIVLSGLMIACMVTILGMQLTFENTYGPLRCGLSIFADDGLNGRASADGLTFFAGVNSIYEKLQYLSGNMLDYENLTLASYSEQISPNFEQVKLNISRVPNSTGSSLILTYPSPFNQQSPSSTISSSFPEIMGNYQQEGSLINTAYAKLEETQSSIQKVDNITQLITEEKQQSFRENITNALINLQEVIKNFKAVQTRFNNFTEHLNGKQLGLIELFYYLEVVLVIACCLIIIFMTVAVCGRQKHSYRHGIYIACWFLYLFAIVCFVLTIFFSLSTAASYIGCKYIEPAMENRGQFQSRFGKVFDNQGLANILGACIENQEESNYSVLENQVGSAFLEYLQENSNLFSALIEYRDLQAPNYIRYSLNGLSATILDYQTGKLLDISQSSSDFSILKTISLPFYQNCTSNPNDSWIPNSQQTYIPCQSPQNQQRAQNYATSSQCLTTSIFQTKSGRCYGCMDTYSIFLENTTRNDVFTALSARYPDTSCTNFNSELANIWNNYYFVKKEELTPVKNRAVNAQEDVEGLADYIQSAVDPGFQQFLADMEQNYSSIFNEKYGITAGFKCQSLKQDIQLSVNTICKRIFFNSFLLRIIFATAGFCFVVGKYCMLMVGRRSFHNQRLGLKKSVLKEVITVQSGKELSLKIVQNQEKISDNMKKSKYSSNILLKQSAIEEFLPYL